MIYIIFSNDATQQKAQILIVTLTNILKIEMKNPICCQEMLDYENFPHVSLIIPFEPKMKNETQFKELLTGCVLKQKKTF